VSEIEPLNPDIFLCHSKKDIEFVRQIAHDLEELGIDVWFDELELGVGDSLHDSIAEALERSAHIGVVISPHSVKSRWVRKELNQALCREVRSGKTVIVPLRVRGAPIPTFLEDKFYLNFTGRYFSSLTLLAGFLQNLKPRMINEELLKVRPKTTDDVRTVLRNANRRNRLNYIVQREYERIVEIFAKAGVPIKDDRFEIMTTNNMRYIVAK